MRIEKLTLVLSMLFLFGIGCIAAVLIDQNHSREDFAVMAQEETIENAPSEGSALSAGSSASTMSEGEQKARFLLLTWSDALNRRDRRTLDALYKDGCRYYGMTLTNRQIAEKHNSFFSKYAYFYQECKNVSVSYQGNNSYYISFNKYVKTSQNGEFKMYPSYLSVTIINGRALICLESDKITDANLAKRQTQSSNSNPWSSVTRWDITLYSQTTILKNISASTAARVTEIYGDEAWAEWDQDEHSYVVHYHTTVTTGHAVITDSYYVSRLNNMMRQPQYREWMKNVKIQGNTAYARWYDGNRGGGIEDDFPSEISGYINKKAGR